MPLHRFESRCVFGGGSLAARATRPRKPRRCSTSASRRPSPTAAPPVTIRFDALAAASAADPGRVPRSTLVLYLFDDVSCASVLDRIDPAAAPWLGARVFASGSESDASPRRPATRTAQARKKL